MVGPVDPAHTFFFRLQRGRNPAENSAMTSLAHTAKVLHCFGSRRTAGWQQITQCLCLLLTQQLAPKPAQG